MLGAAQHANLTKSLQKAVRWSLTRSKIMPPFACDLAGGFEQEVKFEAAVSCGQVQKTQSGQVGSFPLFGLGCWHCKSSHVDLK